MKKNNIQEGILGMFKKQPQEDPKPQFKRIDSMLGGKMNLTADDFTQLDPNTSADKLKDAFKTAYIRGNNESRASLKTLLDKEPYSELKDLVDQIDNAKLSKPMSKSGASDTQSVRRSSSGFPGLSEETLRLQMLSGIITENEYKLKLNEYVEPSFPSEQAWNLWLRFSNEYEFDDYNLETFNHLQVGGLFKELQWIEDNKDKYSDEELSQAFSDYLDELY